MTTTLADFIGPITPSTITEFFNNCDDAFTILSWSAKPTNGDQGKILLAGTRLKEPNAAQWWHSIRASLLKMSWEGFKKEFRQRFTHSNPQLDALRRFFAIHQGERDYRDFVLELQLGYDVFTDLNPPALSIISRTQYKHLLVFQANSALIARVVAVNKDATIFDKSEADLIMYMIRDWDALKAGVEARIPGDGIVPLAGTSAGPAAPSSADPSLVPYGSGAALRLILRPRERPPVLLQRSTRVHPPSTAIMPPVLRPLLRPRPLLPLPEPTTMHIPLQNLFVSQT